MATEKKPDTPRCPICARPPVPRFHPFCSKRCAEVDLGRWLTGQYSVPVTETEPDEPPDEPA